jgi:hypothetical protein
MLWSWTGTLHLRLADGLDFFMLQDNGGQATFLRDDA